MISTVRLTNSYMYVGNNNLHELSSSAAEELYVENKNYQCKGPFVIQTNIIHISIRFFIYPMKSNINFSVIHLQLFGDILISNAEQNDITKK